MKKIDFEKMEKIEGGKILKEPQITTTKKNQPTEVPGISNVLHNKISPIV